MSKKSRTKQGHNNPTQSKNRRRERNARLDRTVYQQAALDGQVTKKGNKRLKELRKLQGLL